MLTSEFSIFLAAIFFISFVIMIQGLQPRLIENVVGNDIEYLDLILGCHSVTRSTLLDFQSYECVFLLHVFG
jgi:hypothetical protein